jgi:hypothetical protein
MGGIVRAAEWQGLGPSLRRRVHPPVLPDSEHRWGSFERSVGLPVPVVSDQAAAEFENGVLTITLPKAEEAKPKTINIKAK